MLHYFITRLVNGHFVLFGVVSLVFIIFELKPGDPARMLADQRSSPEALEAIRRDLGLGLPLGTRYLLYLNDLSPLAIMQDRDRDRLAYLDEDRYTVLGCMELPGDRLLVMKAPYLRFSYHGRRGVADILAEAFPNTAILAVLSMLLAVVLGLVMGTWAAVRKGTWVDSGLLAISALGVAGPSFFVAVLVAWLGGFVWFERIPVPLFLLASMTLLVVGGVMRRWHSHGLNPWPTILSMIGIILLGMWVVGGFMSWPWATHALVLPGTGLPMSGNLLDVDPFTGPFLNWKHLVLPVIVLGIRPLAIVVQLTRSSLLDVLSQDHIRTARAIGLSEWDVVVRHGLRNALMPVLTAVSGWFASLLAGAVFVEYVFGWKGMGLEVFNALEREDLPVVMGAVLVFATVFVLMNMVVDLLYAVLDPRVRTG